MVAAMELARKTTTATAFTAPIARPVPTAVDQSKILVDGLDAGVKRVAGPFQHKLAPVEHDAAAVGREHAGQDLQQCGLACAVVTDKAERLALAQLYCRVGDSHHGSEISPDVLGNKDDRAQFRRPAVRRLRSPATGYLSKRHACSASRPSPDEHSSF